MKEIKAKNKKNLCVVSHFNTFEHHYEVHFMKNELGRFEGNVNFHVETPEWISGVSSQFAGIKYPDVVRTPLSRKPRLVVTVHCDNG